MRQAIVIGLMALAAVGGIWGAHALHQRAARIHVVDAGAGHTIICTSTSTSSAVALTCKPGNSHEPIVDNAVAAALGAGSIGLIVRALAASRTALRRR